MRWVLLDEKARASRNAEVDGKGSCAPKLANVPSSFGVVSSTVS